MTENPLQMVPFSKLTAPDEINARSKSKEGLDELAASIAVKGIIQPLAVRPGDGGKFEVIDGRRRYMALAKLVKDGTMKKSDLVPVLERNETDAEALETSLVANVVRLPMHPVDQHVVFDRLVASGANEQEIAARFGITEKTVKQHLALGRLAPKIRDDWKKEKISADVAKAFAAHDNQDVQASTYDRLRKEFGQRIGVHHVRTAFAGSSTPINDMPEFKLVGEAAYVAAGGTIKDDLFSDDKFGDVPLLKKLADDVIGAKLDELVAAGWNWAEDSSEFDGDVWSADNVKDDAEGEDPYDVSEPYNPSDWTAEEKARSGCVVELESNGELRVYAGVVKGESDDQAAEIIDESDEDEVDAGAGVMPAKADDDGDDLKISGALMRTVSENLTVATAAALERQPSIALRAAVAALISSGYSQPVKLSKNGWPSEAPAPVKFEAVFATLEGVSDDGLVTRFGILVAQALDMRTYNGAGPSSDDRALIAAIDGNAFTLEARKAFNATDYFVRAGKAIALAALEEIREAGMADGLAPEDVVADMKKTELAGAAADFATRSGWLPPELRHPSYELDLTKIPIAAE